MNFLLYYILFKNFELADCEIQFQDLSTLEDPPGDTVSIYLTGAEIPAVLDTPQLDQDKTKSIRGKRFKASFLSGDEYDIDGTPSTVDVETFSDGQEGRFLTRITCDTLALPFLGNIVLDDNVEAFQPKANVVTLSAGDGLGTLRDVELTESDGDIPLGHYRIIDYITLSLRNLAPSQDIHVVFNLCETDGLRGLSVNFAVTAANMFRIAYEHLGFLQVGDVIEVIDSASNDGTYTITTITPNSPISIDIEVSTSTFVLETSEAFIFRQAYHAFFDTFLEARTFETEQDGRDNCYTVLEKIFDALGCFICYDQDGWWIIRWDEYDKILGGVTTLKTGHFNSDGVFQGYTDVSVDKFITHDGDPLYEGYRLSMDNALRRFQRKAGNVKHVFKFEQPNEVPCNSSFTKGTKRVESPEDETYDDYDFDCWTLFKGPPNVSNDGDAYVKVIFEAGQESERYLLFEVQPSAAQYYVESEQTPVRAGGKFSLSVDIRHNGQVETIAGPGNYNVMQVRLYADDGTFYTLHPPEPTDTLSYWEASDVTWATNNNYFKRFFDGDDDDTEWHSVGADYQDLAAIPKDGYITIGLHQTKKSDQFETHFSSLSFEYVALIDGSYGIVSGQEHSVTGTDDSRKKIEKEMFISDSPEALYKGALKKFAGPGYELTETWNYYHDPTVLTDSPLAKHIVFQWWNQFRKTRTVIETDLQGLRSTIEFGIPGLIHRWKIIMGGQEDKYFMLTSIPSMEFYNCGWRGMFVEMSDTEGDRNYDDTHLFKYINE